MQTIVTFTRHDGTQDKATIRTSKRKFGYVASVKIGPICRVVTAVHPDSKTAQEAAKQGLKYHREHCIL